MLCMYVCMYVCMYACMFKKLPIVVAMSEIKCASHGSIVETKQDSTYYYFEREESNLQSMDIPVRSPACLLVQPATHRNPGANNSPCRNTQQDVRRGSHQIDYSWGARFCPTCLLGLAVCEYRLALKFGFKFLRYRTC